MGGGQSLSARSLAGIGVYLERPVLTQLFLGFSSGLPYLLVFSTLSAWLREADLSLSEIGWFALAGSAYVFKFAWAPLIDQLRFPVLSGLLGRRRGWLLFAQVGTAAAILGLGATDPSADLRPTAFWAVILALFSATQDVVADAYRIESLERAVSAEGANRQGAGAALFVNGYRFGTLAAGAGALLIADMADWRTAYMAMAALMTVGVVTTLLAHEPEAPPRTEATLGARFRAAVIAPFEDFKAREHWPVILAFIAFFQFGDGLLGLLANPFYLDIGYSKTDIAIVAKGWGLAMSLVGALVGGMLVFRLGVLKALLVGGVLQALSNLAFVWLAASAAHGTPGLEALAVTIAAENLTSAMATAAFVAYLSGLCHRAYTATQYALLSAVAHLGRKVFAATGGEMAERLDWAGYFLLTCAAAVPALALLVWLMKRTSYKQGRLG